MIFFYLLVGVLPLEEHWFWRQELLGSLTVIKAMGGVCLLLALGRIFAGRVNPQVLHCPPTPWYFALVALQCDSYFLHGENVAVDPSAYWHVVSILSLFVVTVTFVNSPRPLSKTLLVAISAAGFASLYTIRGQQVGGGLGVRPSGIFADANYYALVMGLWIPVAFLLATSRRPRWERMLCFGSLASMLLGTTFAASRGGFLGLGAALLFLVWHSSRRLRNFGIIAVLTVPLLLYAPSSPLRRFSNPSLGDQQAQEARLIAWRAAWGMIQAHPLIGVGFGNFEQIMERYRDPGNKKIISVAHNTYLETAAELGIPALMVQIGVLLTAFVTLDRVRRRARRHTDFCNVALGLQAGLVSYFISAFFVSTWWQEMAWFPVFLTISLHYVAKRRGVLSKSRRPLSVDSESLPITTIVGSEYASLRQSSAVR